MAETDAASWISSNARQEKQVTNSKVLNARITNFIDMLDNTTKNTRPVAQMKDFDQIQKVVKENKQIKRGVVRYLEMITSNPKKADMANSVADFMEERQAQK